MQSVSSACWIALYSQEAALCMKSQSKLISRSTTLLPSRVTVVGSSRCLNLKKRTKESHSTPGNYRLVGLMCLKWSSYASSKNCTLSLRRCKGLPWRCQACIVASTRNLDLSLPSLAPHFSARATSFFTAATSPSSRNLNRGHKDHTRATATAHSVQVLASRAMPAEWNLSRGNTRL